MSYSSKLKSKYNLTTDLIQVNRCLTIQQPFQNQLTKQYNLRRIHQLYLNIARYEYVHFLYREYGSAVLMRPWRWSLIEPIEMIFLVFDMKESKMLINDNINDIMKENIE